MSRSVIRFGRNLLGLVVAGGLAYAQQNPAYMVLGPVLNAVAKYLREKSYITWLPV